MENGDTSVLFWRGPVCVGAKKNPDWWGQGPCMPHENMWGMGGAVSKFYYVCIGGGGGLFHFFSSFPTPPSFKDLK